MAVVDAPPAKRLQNVCAASFVLAVIVKMHLLVYVQRRCGPKGVRKQPQMRHAAAGARRLTCCHGELHGTGGTHAPVCAKLLV